MKKRILLITLIGMSFGIKAQITDTGSNVGIGTTNPSKTLDVRGDIINGAVSASTYGSNMIEGRGAVLQLKSYGNDVNTFNQWSLYSHTTNGSLYFRKESNSLNPQDLITFNSNGDVGIGTTNPDSKLSVNGKIHTKEVKVDLIGWSDFVFLNDYKLPTLAEVENHIKEKGHLKDIPSAKEVKKNGIFLGEMNSKLLQKIEELTLYTIQQEKEIVDLNKLKSKVQTLEKENKSLKFLATKFLELQKRMEKLEKE